MRKINLACASDIHLGHRRNEARAIVNNLRAAFPDNAETAELDIIFLAGDVFDDLLSLNSDDVMEIDFWIAHFLRTCKKHNILVRVLEGTPSHDWRQSDRFTGINGSIAGIGANLKHVKQIEIEYIQDLDIWVLYVPDEICPTTEETLSQVRELLKAKGLDKVDIAIMHGQFEYQLPAHIPAQKHDSKSYLDLVEHLILIGHVHTHSRLDRIIAQGSFDRLSHGEEEAKGHVRATIGPGMRPEVHFIENQGARRFVTIDCMGLTVDEALVKVDRIVPGLPDLAFVRIKCESDSPVFQSMDVFIRRYPLISWSKQAEKPQTEEELEEVATSLDYVPIMITPGNIEELLMGRVVKTLPSEKLLQSCHHVLAEVMQWKR